jgi:AraC family transcriptional regulator
MRVPETAVAGKVVREQRYAQLHLTENLYPEGLYLPSHEHSSAYLTLVLAGPYREALAHRTEICAPSTVRFLPAHERHVDHYHRGARCLHIEIAPSLLKRAAECQAVLQKPGEVRGAFLPFFATRLRQEFYSDDPLAGLAIESLVLEILVHGARAERNGESPAQPPWLRAVKEALADQLARKPSIEDIARHAGVHPVHLCRAFRNHYGCTIGEFVRRLRVDRASEMLSGTSRPLSEIALHCGFADQSHFSTTFRKYTGLTPARFRAGR